MLLVVGRETMSESASSLAQKETTMRDELNEPFQKKIHTVCCNVIHSARYVLLVTQYLICRWRVVGRETMSLVLMECASSLAQNETAMLGHAVCGDVLHSARYVLLSSQHLICRQLLAGKHCRWYSWKAVLARPP